MNGLVGGEKRIGGIAALAAAATFVVRFVMAVTVLSDYTTRGRIVIRLSVYLDV